MIETLKILDTFAGIGGFSYAANELVGGFETTQFVEIDPFCQKVLKNIFPKFLAMTISKPSQLTLDNMMSSQEVSPAKTSVSQEEEKELQTNPDQVYFTNSSESYAWYDQSSLSWKTWQRSLITDWTSFSESFRSEVRCRMVNYICKFTGAAHRRSRWWCVAYTNDYGSSSSSINEINDQTDSSSVERQNQVSESSGAIQSFKDESDKCGTVRSSKGNVTNSNSEGLQRKILSKMESGIWSAKHTRRLDPS